MAADIVLMKMTATEKGPESAARASPGSRAQAREYLVTPTLYGRLEGWQSEAVTSRITLAILTSGIRECSRGGPRWGQTKARHVQRRRSA